MIINQPEKWILIKILGEFIRRPPQFYLLMYNEEMMSLLKIPLLRLKYRFFPDDAQRFWAQELLNSQGLTAKIGQVLAQGKSAELPKSSISKNEAKKIFEEFFKASVKVLNEGLAASMGQVFFIEVNEKKYAIKCLHPGIREKLTKEIDNILILGSYFAKAKGFHFEKSVFKKFLTDIFEEETDLIREAQFQKKFADLFRDGAIKVPEVISEYSNQIMLCQELVPSQHPSEVNLITEFSIFHFFFHSLLKHNLLHGDLNDRNWGLWGEKVVVYDYGCSQTISSRRIGGLLKLLRNENPHEGFLELGVRLEATWFKGKEQELRDALFLPLLGTIKPEWSFSSELKTEFGKHIRALREYTDPWVLLMMRSLFSLIRVYQEKKIPIPLGEILKPYLIVKQNNNQATQIRIQVMENGEQVIFMTLPLTALDNIGEMIPGKVASQIEKEQISLQEITARVKESEFMPQTLFELSISPRNYKIWID